MVEIHYPRNFTAKRQSPRFSCLLLTLLIYSLPFLTNASPVQGMIRVLKIEGQSAEAVMDGIPIQIQIGSTLKQGSVIRTGESSSVDLLPNTEFSIERFVRDPFDAANTNYRNISSEPSISKTQIKIDTGTVLMGIKKLKSPSDFNIRTEVGTTGIRGTSLFVKYDKAEREDGVIVGVAEGVVEFMTSSGSLKSISGGESFQITDNGSGATFKPNPRKGNELLLETLWIDSKIRESLPAHPFTSSRTPPARGASAPLERQAPPPNQPGSRASYSVE